MRFFKVNSVSTKRDVITVSPEFIIGDTDDLMIKGGAFYAIWDEEIGLWNTNEYRVASIVDEALWERHDELKSMGVDGRINVETMSNFSSGSWSKYKSYLMRLPDNFKTLDENLTFANTVVKKEDYVSKRLPYALSEGDCPAWEELVSTLYGPLEKRKIEWAVGSIVAGDAKYIQKFFVFYGDAGTGKSTILNIIQKLFDGYYCIFDSKALGSASNQFSLESFKNNPLVAIQHDGDLSKIDDNSRLNSIVSHEEIVINEKRKSMYTMRMNPILLMGTNKPVKITDGKSGLIRRLIDISPTGRLLSSDKYQEIMNQIDFELGAIAKRCLDVYTKCGIHYYDRYRSTDMRYKTDIFFNFVDENFFLFSTEPGVTLKQAYALYKEYCDDTSLQYKMPMYAFREELKNYFSEFYPRIMIEGVSYRSYYTGFLTDRFEENTVVVYSDKEKENDVQNKFELNTTLSIFDEECKDCPAQYATEDGRPINKWVNVTTKLSELDTTKVHYVRIPENHIVIDFDLKDPETGEKSAELNLEAASKFPLTYAEFSKSGAGIHLHYIYDGDSSRLSRLYSDGIEIKVFSGNSSLRRRLSLCNHVPIAHLSGGLPLKEKKVINERQVKSEKALRDLIIRNLRKEIHPATKPSVDFIYKILDDAYNSELSYDVGDLSGPVLAFCANSTNNAGYCIKTFEQMKFCSKDRESLDRYENTPSRDVHVQNSKESEDDPIVFFDIEVFPNLLLINYKAEGEDKPMHRMINPAPAEMEELFKLKLVGYNNRKYDNHIIYARYLGKSNEEIYQMSKAIVSGTKEEQRAAMYGEAYNLSYTDVYDFASAGNKMSLKKAEIEMGIHHLELGMDWDQPVPEEEWTKVSEYCDNDVLATEARFHYLKADWIARQILSDLAGMTVNDTTNTLTTKFIFGDNRTPQREFNYRNLGQPVRSGDCPKSMIDFLNNAKPDMMNAAPFVHPLNPGVESVLPYFPGYKFEWTEKVVAGRKIRQPVSTYRGEVVGEGGYVYSEAGIYTNVALLDITSMHPNSSIDECIFGARYTLMLKELIDARVAIKHEDWDSVSKMLDGRLIPYVEKVLAGEITSNDLALALKTAINSVYGLSSAKFPNAFKDPRNQDNLVAKRGALFMIDLKHAVQEQGFTVAHIKTDSIKIPNATPSIIQFVMDFGKKYGYNFEHEATYSKMCLVNKAVYIAKYKDGKPHRYKLSTGEVVETPWTATGTQFQQPYVFKELFAKAPIKFDDLCETKNVKTALYLDMNEGFPLHSYSQEEYDKEIERISNDVIKKNQLKINNDANPDAKREELIANAVKKYKGPKPGDLVETHNYVFVGRSGQFCPIKEGAGGGKLMREQDGKFVSATDADGYRWLESEMLRNLGMENSVELDYYRKKVDEAVESISSYGDFEWFVSDDDSSDVIEVP